MNRMHIVRLTALAVAALALAGCKREPEPAPPAPIAEAAPAPAADTVSGEVDHSSPAADAPGFDAKAFAGTYAGLVPCADCPGIDMSVAFAADGTYTQTMVYRERDTTDLSQGTWRVAADGKRITLDPQHKDEMDGLMEILSPTEVRMLDAEGNAIESGMNYTLTRR
ncbi:hypothetical protein MASR1M8_11120 [Thermomonas brevis]